MSEIVQYQDDFMSHPKMWAIPEEKKFLMFVDNNFSYDRQWFEWYLFLWNCKNEMKKQKFCSREAKMRAILTSCPHRRERHLQSAKPWQGGVRGLSLEIVDLAIFGHNFEISASKREHMAHPLQRAHEQLGKGNPHHHLPPFGMKKKDHGTKKLAKGTQGFAWRLSSKLTEFQNCTDLSPKPAKYQPDIAKMWCNNIFYQRAQAHSYYNQIIFRTTIP